MASRPLTPQLTPESLPGMVKPGASGNWVQGEGSDIAMSLRKLTRTLAYLIVGSGVLLGDFPRPGEAQAPVSRGDLVSVMERAAGPGKGSADAPVVMVEFSDFQCLYCRKFWRETLPQIEERYIRTGKARFVYRHLAVLGEPSILAAQAASCAQDQEKFWGFHDALFGKAAPLAFTSARLKRYAAELGLDEKAFGTCLDSKKYAKLVDAETTIGRALGATGTPAFLLNGRLIIGAFPFETFRQALDELLAGPARAPSGQTR